ncbi:MAG: hypothetical protein OEW60_03970, partial [Thiovulaceae bacterium]|nr:hypothetical protein [Sulfurimonadaceae bacterium]
KTEEYLLLKGKGIDIDACKINFKELSVRCEDLSLFRKALRVKIRALIKLDDRNQLRSYANALYRLAQFSRYLYGFHSCNSEVSFWQEELAVYLQTRFDESKVVFYEGNTWLVYKNVDSYCSFYKAVYRVHLSKTDTVSPCIQDAKPFLNLKDKSHFDKYL